MKWSYRLGKVAGIDVNIHITFTLLIAWVLLTHWLSGQTLGAAVNGLAFVLAIFGCVLLHELGHALAARRFGIGTRDITLLPIGGVARLERMPEKPLQELWVALAGPAVNGLIAIVLYVWLVMTNQLVPLSQLGVVTGPFVERLLVVNVLLIVFNMIPAFPMDGGRCVRALLALRLEYAQATRIAAGLGQVIAVGFVVLGLFSNPFLLLIGVFVWLGAAQEARHATLKAALRGVNLLPGAQIRAGDRSQRRIIERTYPGHRAGMERGSDRAWQRRAQSLAQPRPGPHCPAHHPECASSALPDTIRESSPCHPISR